MKTSYYNDNDSFAARWLEELIRGGHLPHGSVDARSIIEVVPSDLGSFRQCHFFAGIGGWARALALAEWPEERECWTASLPCQPLSVAGTRQGALDGRHLWPAFYRLVEVCRPPIIFGEQVASKDGREWFAGIRTDLEELGYACGAANLPACAAGAPHRRERLFWGAVANPDGGDEPQERSGDVPRGEQPGRGWAEVAAGAGAASGNGGMANAEQSGERGRGLFGSGEGEAAQRGRASTELGGTSADGGVDDATSSRHSSAWGRQPQQSERRQRLSGMGCAGGFWSDAEWRTGADGKSRRVKPGVRLLVDGFPNRVGALRGFGNAIVPQVAAEFIKAVMDLG